MDIQDDSLLRPDKKHPLVILSTAKNLFLAYHFFTSSCSVQNGTSFYVISSFAKNPPLRLKEISQPLRFFGITTQQKKSSLLRLLFPSKQLCETKSIFMEAAVA
jgi:hypothetical protein